MWMQSGSDPGHGALRLINAKNEILWIWTKYIEGKWKKDTLNENLSMAIYALVHKLLQKKSKKKSKSQRNHIMK
jgi:hypothetical protein